MADLIKLTDEHGQTFKGTQWGPGITHTAPGTGPLCSEGWIHAYEGTPELALFFNPIHADFKSPRVWVATGEVGIRNGQLKCGTMRLTTVRELDTPAVTTTNRVAFAILCALEVCKEEPFAAWAHKWLYNEERAEAGAAGPAAWAAGAAGPAAWAAAAWAAAAAAEAAAEAWAAAAWAAAAAAEAAAEANLDLVSIASKAMMIS